MLIESLRLYDSEPDVYLDAYIQEPSKELPFTSIKPAIVIFPGGGYQFISDREAEIVALNFLKEGFQCFVLHYSLNEKAVFPKPLRDAEKAMDLIHENRNRWYIDVSKIAVIGFSAGAHLATMLSTSGLKRPKALIAGYSAFYPIPEINYHFPLPVVDEKSPEAFIFHTYEDGFVPVKNAMYLANQYLNAAIPFEIHVFRDGGHGLSLGTEQVKNYPDFPIDTHYQHWFELSVEWLRKVLG